MKLSCSTVVVVLPLLLCAPTAWADLSVVVGSSSPVGTLSKQQVADIFMGRTSTFPDGSQATPIALPEGTEGRAELYDQLTGKTEAQIRAYRARLAFTGIGQPPKVVPNAGELKKLLTNNPNLVGYVDDKSVDGTVKVVLKR